VNTEKRALQVTIAAAGLVPVTAGLAGALEGPAFLGEAAGQAGMDSHFRYLSGLLLGLGLAFWACIPHIERRTVLVRALTLIVVGGGLARAYGLFRSGWPGTGMATALAMELAVAPLICLWQARVAGRAG
jgi:hypothetical protein